MFKNIFRKSPKTEVNTNNKDDIYFKIKIHFKDRDDYVITGPSPDVGMKKLKEIFTTTTKVLRTGNGFVLLDNMTAAEIQIFNGSKCVTDEYNLEFDKIDFSETLETNKE